MTVLMKDAPNNQVYATIAARMAKLNPGIRLEDHIDELIEIGHTTLDGITFSTENYQKLLDALRNAKDDYNNKAFVEGVGLNTGINDPQGEPDQFIRHSFDATHGIGFREIWRLNLPERPLTLEDASPNSPQPFFNRRFSGSFNDPVINQSSLHCAVSNDYCNIHIDEMGFIINGPHGVILDPDFIQHTLNELLFKTNLKNKIPDLILEHMSLEFLNSTNGYTRLGVSGDFYQTKNLRIRATASCSVLEGVDCSFTVSVSGTHDFLGHR